MARVLVPLAQGCEELEAVSIIDLLRRADIEVVTAGLTDGAVTCSRGVVMVPDTSLDEVLGDDFDMMVLPGGLPGADYLDQDVRIRRILQHMAKQGKYTAAICAAPKVLASAGVLQGKQATSYPGVIDAMQLEDTRYIDDQAVVIDGKVITSRGPGTAMDFALVLIEVLAGAGQRNSVEASLLRPANP